MGNKKFLLESQNFPDVEKLIYSFYSELAMVIVQEFVFMLSEHQMFGVMFESVGMWFSPDACLNCHML